MQRFRFVLYICCFVIMMTFPGYAAATSSNAGSVIILPEGIGPADYEASLIVPETFESFETESVEGTETDESAESEAEEVLDPDSDEEIFDFSNLEDMIMELLGGINVVSDQETEISVLEDQEELPLLGEITPYFPTLLMAVIRQIKCCLIPQIKNDFLRYAEALRSELFAAISAHCFMYKNHHADYMMVPKSAEFAVIDCLHDGISCDDI